MAAIGSAVGLGNLWRFPYVCAANGGGAFLIPYFIALLTAGIPIMIIEYGLGTRAQASAHQALAEINPKFAPVGWVAILGAFVVNIYYCVVMAWAWNFLFQSFTMTEWAATLEQSTKHFNEEVLGLTTGPWEIGSLKWPLFFGLLGTWFFMWMIIRGGLGRIGRVLLLTVPLPVILVIVLVIRGITLEGASVGLNYYLAPDFSKLADPAVWRNAYGQIFFSLSLGFGTLLVYASFMPRNTEVPNSAFITSFANCAFSFLAGFAVFSVLGYVAYTAAMGPDGIVDPAVAAEKMAELGGSSGPGLAFVVYPMAIAKLPFWVPAFGFLFFLTLLTLGIDSAFSLLETTSASLMDKFGWKRLPSVTLVAVISFGLGLPMVTGAGLYWLDIIDHYALGYIITTSALLECVIVGWGLGAGKLADEVNRNAEIKIGRVWGFMVKFFTPLALGGILIWNIVDEFRKPYGGYAKGALVLGAVLAVGVVVVLALALSAVRGRRALAASTSEGQPE
jgi:NSS family neurotransmitter:Na+ symporter